MFQAFFHKPKTRTKTQKMVSTQQICRFRSYFGKAATSKPFIEISKYAIEYKMVLNCQVQPLPIPDKN